jgi:Protein  of unknown function (DUF3018)
MADTGDSRSSRERVRSYRERQRAKGLKPVTFWLPDVNTPEFRAEARRQSLLVAQNEDKELTAWIDSLTDEYLRMLDEEEEAADSGRAT